MGRWAQRTRGGGGINALNHITSARYGAIEIRRLTYREAVDATQLDATKFASGPSGITGIGITQIDPHTIDVEMSSDIGTDTSVTYTGTTPGVQTPQTVTIS